MSASCLPTPNSNKCSAWKVASNRETCQNLTTPLGPYPTIDSCQVNTASCANASGPSGGGGIYARWGASAPIKPGPMARGPNASPYPFCRSYAFSQRSNQCQEVPHTTPGASVGAQTCVGAHSPFVYKGPTF